MKTTIAKTFLPAAVLLAVAVFGGNIVALAQTLTSIHSFPSNGSDGQEPYPQHLAIDSHGAVYGTTVTGGSTQSEWGTVFQLVPPANPGGAWTATIIYTFQGGYDGYRPGEVTFGPNGSLYGTTQFGGVAGVHCQGGSRDFVGCGTVFELTPPAKSGGKWTKTILHNFPAYAGDGLTPTPDVIFDSQGNLYGAAGGGGTSRYGMVFQLTPSSKEAVLYDFTGGSDGGYPGGGLVLGANGVLYGTASYSGVLNASGVVFQLTPPAGGKGAWSEAVLHTFPAFGRDGTTPGSTLALDQNSNLYGTTDFGGSSNCGTVFKLAPVSGGGEWTETILQDWACPNSGSTNESRVVYDNGLLYGTTIYLGSANLGQAFTLVP